MNPRAGIEAYGLPHELEELEKILVFSEAPSRNTANLKEMVLKSCGEFNSGQRKVLDILLNEIFPGVTAKDPFATITHHSTTKVRDPVRTSLTRLERLERLLTLLLFRQHHCSEVGNKLRYLLVQLLHHFWNEGEQRTRYSKYQSPALKIVFAPYQWIPNWQTVFVVLT